MSKCTYDSLKADAKHEYEQRAREIIYPGLEPAYAEHHLMVSILSRALYKIERLKMAGPQVR